MSVDLITLIVVGLFFFLLVAETPVSFALAASGARSSRTGRCCSR